MTKHESSVNFENLIKDLADMYPFDVGTVALVELVANALDSRATTISIDFDPHTKALIVTDNGTGMTEPDFEQYHDFAAGLKTRGMGIGFAGVGAKISFNIASKVITETRSDSFLGGSNWYLESKGGLSWEDITPTNIQNKGTRVEVMFRHGTELPFSDTRSIVLLLKQHYLPLFDNDFLLLYEKQGRYSTNLRFIVNGEVIEPSSIISDYALTSIKQFVPKSANRRIGLGIFGLAPNEYALGEGLCGVILCTMGKVIKADMFNQFPSDVGPCILGLVEIPDFIHFLTSSKTDFIKRLKYREFEKLYGPVRQEFRAWLSELGIQSTEYSSTDEALKLERELQKLIDEIPELNDFFGFRGPKSVLKQSSGEATDAAWQEGAEVTFPLGEGEFGGGEGPLDVGEGPGEALQENHEGNVSARPITRTSRRGPKVAFNEASDRIDLSWIDGTNVVINSGHPSFIKASHNASSKRLHNIFVIALAIQKFIFTGQDQDLMFSDRMMAAWGRK